MILNLYRYSRAASLPVICVGGTLVFGEFQNRFGSFIASRAGC